MYALIKRQSIAAVIIGATLFGVAQAAEPSIDPPAFVNAAAQAGMTEIELGKLAVAKSTNAAVKAFATRMITDHEKVKIELAAIAKKKSIPVSAQIDAERARTIQSLSAAGGQSFDTMYAGHMVQAHAEAVALFQANVTSPDGELAAFAAKTLPLLQDHKRLADNLKAKLGN